MTLHGISEDEHMDDLIERGVVTFVSARPSVARRKWRSTWVSLYRRCGEM